MFSAAVPPPPDTPLYTEFRRVMGTHNGDPHVQARTARFILGLHVLFSEAPDMKNHRVGGDAAKILLEEYVEVFPDFLTDQPQLGSEDGGPYKANLDLVRNVKDVIIDPYLKD